MTTGLDAIVVRSVLLAVLLSLAFWASAAEPRKLVLSDFEDEAAVQNITLAAVEVRLSDQNVSSGRKSLQITFPPFEKTQYQWPRAELGPKFLGRPSWDLTYYSKLKADVTNAGAESVSLMLSLTSFDYFDRFGSESLYEDYLIPAGNTMTVELDTQVLRRGTTCNLSSIRWIQFRCPPPSGRETVLRVDNLRLEHDPAHGSPMEALRGETEGLLESLARLDKLMNVNARPGLKAKVAGLRDQYTKQLTAVKGRITRALAMVDGIDTVVYVPEAQGLYPGLRADVNQIKLELNRLVMSDKPALYAWMPKPYAPVASDTVPDITAPALIGLKLTVAGGECRDAVFAVTENGGRERAVAVSVLTTDPKLQGRLTVDQAFSAKPGAIIKGDAFFALDGPMALPAGESRPVRVAVDNADGGLPPGTASFTLVLKDTVAGQEQRFPGTVVVRRLTLPGHEVLPNNSYAELCQYPFASAATLLQDMRRGGLNMVYYLQPYPTVTGYDAATHEIKVDATAFRQRVQEYLAAWGAGSKPQFIFSPVPRAAAGVTLPSHPSAAWDEVVRRGVKTFVATCAELGLGYSDWMFVLADESSESHLVNWEVPLAELIKSVEPQVRITTNSSAIIRDPALAQRYFKAMDIFQPHLGQTVDPELFAWLKSSGRPVWVYRCSWSGNLYDDYRVYVWEMLKLGATGTGVWTYCSEGSRHYYNPAGDRPNGCILVYPHPTLKDRVIPTNRYVAYRHGLDDYRYVHALRQVGARTGHTAEAAAMVEAAVNDIVGHRTDPGRAETWRLKIADTIEAWSQ